MIQISVQLQDAQLPNTKSGSDERVKAYQHVFQWFMDDGTGMLVK